MYDYILDRLNTELYLHFKLQEVMQNYNKTEFDFWDIMRYDLYREYIFYCNLNNKDICNKEFNSLLNLVEITLSNKGYNIEYDTDKDLLLISKSC